MEQNTITNEELHGIITDLVHKVESLECCILTLVDPQSGDKLMDTKELCEYMHKSKSTIYRITNGRLVPHIKQGNLKGCCIAGREGKQGSRYSCS